MVEKPNDVEAIYHAALAYQSPAERSAYLDAACHGDSALRAHIEGLLKAHEELGDFLESPPAGAGVTLDSSPRIDGPGTTMGRYVLLELLGEGGMGLVYLAEQKEPVRRKVAFKIIKPGMDSRQVVARFEAERQALAVLDHPNIAHVYDAGCTETGRPYFVMEHVKGMSITRYCDEHKLTIEQRLRLFEQVCEGAQHAHQKGIIHRDLKPSNILVSVHGDRATPKIIDFGIAKAMSSPLTDKTFVTLQGQLLGTPEYMSPEQVDLATQDIDTRSDIYSLGVVLYELLAGVLPFESESFAHAGLAEIQQTIREQEPASPSNRLTGLGEKAHTIAASRSTQLVPLARRLHRELEWIPLKAMRKDRCRRYRSAAELADDIRNYLTGLPLLAGPETTVYRVQKFVRKHAGSVATVVLVAVAIFLGLVATTIMYSQAERARGKEALAREQEAAARMEADVARSRAEAAEEAANQKAEELRRALYVNSIQLADAKHREGNAGQVRTLLDSCPNDLRCWEWNRLSYIQDQSIMTLRAHRNTVAGNVLCIAAFSPDGRRIVSGGDGRTIRLWDSQTGAEVRTLRGHQQGIKSAAFSPDGQWIVSGGDDETIRLWDSQTGTEVRTFHGHRDWVNSVAFSPDGQRIVSGSDDETIRLWDSQTGAEVRTLRGHQGWVNSVVFSTDGRRIASTSKDETIKVWDAATGAIVTSVRAHDGSVVSAAFSPDGELIASGGTDNAVKIWDAETGEELKKFRGHRSTVRSVSFTPDGKRVISASEDGTIKVWDPSMSRESTKICGHTNHVGSIAFSPDGKYMATGGRGGDKTIKLWDAQTSQALRTMRFHENSYAPVAFSPDGKRIVSGETWQKTVRVWDTSSGAETMTLSGHQGDIRCVAFSPDGKYIASGSYDKTIKLWDAKSGAEVATLQACPMSVAFSPDGRRIICGGWDRAIKMWDSQTGAEQMTIRAHAQGITSVRFSTDGRLIASSSLDGTAKIWDAITGAELVTLRGHSHLVVWSVAFSPDSTRAVTAGQDETVRLWDTTTGAELLALYANSAVNDVAFSSDGKMIAAGTNEGDIVLWESAEPAGGYELRRDVESASRLVEKLYRTCGSYHDVIRCLRNEVSLDLTVCRLAIALADSLKGGDVETLNWESWAVVSSPNEDVEAYRAALAKAQKANSIEPNDSNILNTLGVAQYRVGLYEDALKTLTKVDSIRMNANESHPENVAFIAMSLQRIGRAEEAMAALERLRELCKNELYAEDTQTQGFLAEAEEVIASGKK